MSLVSMKEVAAAAGVSQATVSFVINGRYKRDIKLSDEVVSRVLRCAEDLGYIRDELASSMVSGRSQVVALLATFMDFLMPTILGYCDAAAEHGYSVRLVSLGQDINKTLKSVIGFRIAGITAIELEEETKNQIHPDFFKYQIPQDGLQGDTGHMSFDQKGAAELAVRHLIEYGHRKIIFVVEFPHPIQQMRLDGYRNVSREHGLQPRDLVYQGDSCQLLDELLEAKPDAVFCSVDHTAMQLLQEMYRRKLTVPETFSLAGFGNIPGSELCSPALTTVAEPYYQTGIRAFENIYSKIHTGHGLPDNLKPLPGTLIVRESTAPNKQNQGRVKQ